MPKTALDGPKRSLCRRQQPFAGKRPSLAELKRQIRALEGGSEGRGQNGSGARPSVAPAGWRFGIEVIDKAFGPGGLAAAGLHEIVPQTQDDMAAAAAFILALIRQRPVRPDSNVARPLLWCQSRKLCREFGAVHGHGLPRFGFDRSCVLFVATNRDADTLWAMEEGARSGSVSAVIGEISHASFKHTQRLNRAGLEGETPVFALRGPGSVEQSAVLTRWRIGRLPAAGLGAGPGVGPDVGEDFDCTAPQSVCWQVVLERCRGGRSGTWHLEWSDETHCFGLVSQFSSRQVQAPAALRVSRPGAELVG